MARAGLASVQPVAHAHGATVNDVVPTAVTGALDTVLRHRGEKAGRFVVSVPISARRRATAGHLGNQVGVLRVPGNSTAVLGPAFRILARLGAFRWFVERQRLITTLVTDLRGPELRLSLLAAPITEVIPVSSITGNVTVAFAVLSYAGTLVVTVIADPRRCPDLPVLVAGLRDELDLLTAPATIR